MALHINTEAALQRFTTKVVQGVDRGLDQMHAVAVKEAPVRKQRKNEGARAKGERIEPRPLRDFPGGPRGSRADRSKQAQVELLSLSARQRVEAFEEALANNPRAATQSAFRFRIASGPNKGQSPTFLKVGRGTLLGVKTAGGNLRSKIRRTDVTVDGTRVSGSLKSGATYSKFMEFGFIHVGGKRVAGKPFMRPAIAAFKSNWRGAFKGNGR